MNGVVSPRGHPRTRGCGDISDGVVSPRGHPRTRGCGDTSDDDDARDNHTVWFKEDGSAVAIGSNFRGQCDIHQLARTSA